MTEHPSTIVADVEAELKAGGKAVKTYLEHAGRSALNSEAAHNLEDAILRNLEDRVVALEAKVKP